MGTGQMMISGGAMILLSLIVLRVNNNFLNTNDFLLESKMGIMAVSLGTSLLEEALSKRYDEVTNDTTVIIDNANDFSSIGTDAGESYPNFDDLDDYNNFTKRDTLYGSIPFNIDCEVYYVDPDDPNQKVNKKTYHKRIDIKVYVESAYESNVAVVDSFKLSNIYSYWYY